MNDDVSAGGWLSFRRQLHAQMPTVPMRGFLIAEQQSGLGTDLIYVQVAREPGRLWCEAVSERFRPPGAPLPSAAALRAAGWTLADDTHPNHWADLSGPAADVLAVELLVCTLHSLYGVEAPDELGVKVGLFPPNTSDSEIGRLLT